MFAENQRPFCFGDGMLGSALSGGASGAASGGAQPAPNGQHMFPHPSMSLGPVHLFAHVVTPIMAGTSRPSQQSLFGQHAFPCPCVSLAPVCTFIHHVFSPAIAGFGAPTTNLSMFGAVNQQPTAGTGIFGAPSVSFGQPRLQFDSFAPTASAAGTSTGLFGQAPAAYTSTSLFGTSAFGAATGTLGTRIKFKPPTGSDTMVDQYGVQSNITTSHQCITLMDEYCNKSLEELRLEDYAANQKGRAAVFSFGATSQQSPTDCLPAVLQPDFNCGATQNTSSFGTPFTWFGEPNNGLVFQAMHQQQPATCGNQFGAPSTPMNKPWPQPSFPTPTTHVACPACGAFVGTTIKYEPSFWIDSTTINGGLSLVYVACQCITCMKEYEHKSLEELQLEDYSADRKYGSKMAAGVFHNTASRQASSVSSQPFAPTLRPSLLFGATENRAPLGTSTTPGALFGSSAPAVNFSGAPVTTSSASSMAAAVPASVFGAPLTTSSCGPAMTRPVAASISGTPVTTSSHGPNAASLVTVNASGTAETFPSYTSMSTSPVAFNSAFGAPVNGFTDTSLGVPELLSSHGPTATSSVVFSPAFGAPAVFGAPMMTSLQRPTVTSSAEFNPPFGPPAVFGAPIMTPLQAPSTTSSAMTSSHSPKATSSVATSTSGTPTNASLSSAMVASPVAASISGTPVTTSTSSSTTESVAARMFGAPMTTSSYTPVETSSVGAATVADPSVTTSSNDSVKINAAGAAGNIGASVTTSSSSSTETSSEGIPIVSPATAGFGTPVTASICSSATKSTGSLASPCTEPNTAPFGVESWRRALGAVDNGSGDGALPAELQPSGVAREHPSSHNVAPPGAVCAICLGPLQHKSSTDSCSHTFCYTCLVEWARVKLECPVCKEQFKDIVQSDPSQE